MVIEPRFSPDLDQIDSKLCGHQLVTSSFHQALIGLKT